MTRACVEGWAQLDGLLSGPNPPDPEDAQALAHAVEEAAQAGLRASLDVDGGRFHLLVDDDPFPAARPELAVALRASLDQVLAAARVQPSSCDSSVRLRRWTRGKEEQTLFVPSARGLEAMTRSVDCATVEAPAGMGRFRRRYLEFAGIAIAAILAWLVVLRSAAPEWAELQIVTGPYADYLQVEPLTAGIFVRAKAEGGSLEEDLPELSVSSSQAWVLEDLARGRLRYRFVDSAGLTLGPAWYGLVLDDGQASIQEQPPKGAVRIEFLP